MSGEEEDVEVNPPSSPKELEAPQLSTSWIDKAEDSSGSVDYDRVRKERLAAIADMEAAEAAAAAGAKTKDETSEAPAESGTAENGDADSSVPNGSEIAAAEDPGTQARFNEGEVRPTIRQSTATYIATHNQEPQITW